MGIAKSLTDIAALSRVYSLCFRVLSMRISQGDAATLLSVIAFTSSGVPVSSPFFATVVNLVLAFSL